MFEILTLGFRNFITFGEKWTRIDFSEFQGMTMIQGINHDTVSDSNNGIGKTTILNALSTVITGSPLKKVPNQGALVNRENGKDCQLEADIRFFGDLIRIERGFKPSYLRVWHKPKDADPDADVKSTEFDKTFREKRETEAYLDNLFGLDIDLIRLVMVSMADADNFFSMKTTDQKAVVERLFNLLLLSEKAAGIKTIRQAIEVDFGKEAARISGLQSGRDRLATRLESAVEKEKQWITTHQTEIDNTTSLLASLSVKLEGETDYREKLNTIDELRVLVVEKQRAVDDQETNRNRTKTAASNAAARVSQLQREIDKISSVDVDVLIAEWDAMAERQKEYSENQATLKEVTTMCNTAQADKLSAQKALDSFESQCPTCGQDWPDQESMDQQLAKLKADLEAAQSHYTECQETKTAIASMVDDSRASIVKPDTSVFPTRDDVVSSKATLESLKERMIEAEEAYQAALLEQDKFPDSDTALKDEISSIRTDMATIKSSVPFESISEIEILKGRLETQQTSLDSLKTRENPHTMTVKELTDELSEEIDLSAHDEMKLEIAECKKLESLLTHKTSPLRNAILMEWVPRLNFRVAEYLEKLDFEYQVRFDADLSCRIYDHEKESTFDELSSGEKERVHIALSLAFRDIFEDMYYPINFYAVDERLDSGLCVHGAIKAADVITELSIIKNRPTFIITHRNEFNEMVDRKIIVEKKNRYSSLKIVDA